MASLGFPIHLSTKVSSPPREQYTIVKVDISLRRYGLSEYQLKSSANDAPQISAEGWPAHAHEMVVKRLKQDGAAKGRCLAVWKSGQVVGFCTWHRPDRGRLVVLDIAVRDDVPAKLAKRLAMAMLFCMRDIAEEMGRATNQLLWSDFDARKVSAKSKAKGALKSRAETLGFGKVKSKPKLAPGERVWERTF